MCTVRQPSSPASPDHHSAADHSQISLRQKHHLHSTLARARAHTHARHDSPSFLKHTHVVNKACASCHSQNNTGLAISGKKKKAHSSQNPTLFI